MIYNFNIYSLKNLQNAIATNQLPSQISYISIGSDRNYSDLILNNVYSLQYSYTSMGAPSSIDVIGFQRKSPRLGGLISSSQIESGDIILGYENDVLIYVGTITTLVESYSTGNHVLTINFDTLLSQFTRQSMIQSSNDIQVITPSHVEVANLDYSFNQVRMGDLLGFLMTESIFSYLIFSNIIPINPPYYGTPELLNADTQIPYVGSTQSTKEEILKNSTYFYQVLIYQDPKGTIIIDTPDSNNISTFTINSGGNNDLPDPNIRSWTIYRSEALVPNNIVYSLIYNGFFPSTDDTNATYKYVPNAKYFPRLNFLYLSQYMAQVKLIVNNIAGSIMTDPGLLELLVNFNNIALQGIVPPNSSNVPSTLNLPASRALAEAIMKSRYVIIEMERNETTKEIPLGKVFYLNSEPWFCTNVNIQCVGSGSVVNNTMTLFGVPLYSITGHWK